MKISFISGKVKQKPSRTAYPGSPVLPRPARIGFSFKRKFLFRNGIMLLFVLSEFPIKAENKQ